MNELLNKSTCDKGDPEVIPFRFTSRPIGEQPYTATHLLNQSAAPVV